MNYDVHVGIIFGLAGKVLAIMVSLIAASLPLTGFMLWWKRANKGKKTSQFINQAQMNY